MCESKICKVCGKSGSFGKRSLVCRKCLYDRDFKSTKIPRKPVKKFTGIEPVSMRSKVSFRKSNE